MPRSQPKYTRLKDSLINVVLLMGVTAFCVFAAIKYYKYSLYTQLKRDPSFIEALLKVAPMIEKDEEKGWRNKPHSSVSSGPTPMQETKRYFRIDGDGSQILNTEPVTLKPNPRYSQKVIWVFGDSSTFGAGSYFDENFVYLMNRDLAPEGVTVKNFSVIGYDSSQILALLRLKLSEDIPKPDFVLFWFGFNDVNSLILNGNKTVFELALFSDYFWQNRYESNSAAIFRTLTELAIPSIQVTIPVWEMHLKLNRINEWIRSRKGYEYEMTRILDLNLEFSKREDPDLYSKFDDALNIHHHPSEKGHYLIYEKIMPRVDTVLSSSFSQ
jgi:lysophospholipase L1-like esterase